MGSEQEQEQGQEKIDLITKGMRELKKFHISSNPKAMFWYGLFQSCVFLLYALFKYIAYFDMLVLMSFFYIVLAYADLEAKRKERKAKQNINQ